MARIQFAGAEQFIPPSASLPMLQKSVQKCKGCDLYREATQAVFGAGAASSKVLLIGEQPGDSEDRAGEPFVGPAGKLLDRALEEAGIDRAAVYVTNAVKHFKFEERGKRRIHKKPTDPEVEACRPWLEAEIEHVRPTMIVCMGATAARSLLGKTFRLTQHRGEFFERPPAAWITATIHPSAILRAPSDEQRHEDYAAFVQDLVGIRSRLKK